MAVIPDALDLPPGSQPWKRSVDNRLAALESQNAKSNQDTMNALVSLSNTVKLLGDQIQELPTTNVVGRVAQNYSLTDQWQTFATIQFRVPTGKPRTDVFVMFNATALDKTSGGATTALGRIQFGSDSFLSSEFDAAKDAGASVVNNVINGSWTWPTYNLIPGSYYSLRLQLRGLHPTAFSADASNKLTFNAIVTHTARTT